MLHYYAKKFFSPTLISPHIDNGNLSVSVVVDEIPVLQVRDSVTGDLQFQPDSSFVQIPHREFLHHEAIHLMSKLAAVTTGQLVIQMYSWNSFTALKTWKIPYKVNRFKSAHALALVFIYSKYSGPALGGAGPNWEQFQSARVPSQLAPRSVLVCT